jgi:hypothetical protein
MHMRRDFICDLSSPIIFHLWPIQPYHISSVTYPPLLYFICGLSSPIIFRLWPIQPYHISSVAYPGLSYFACYLINSRIFGGKLLKAKCVFWFSLQLLSETFVILRRTERETSCIYKRLHVKYPLFYHTLTNLELSRQIFENYSNKNFRVVHCRLIDGRTDRQTWWS